MNVMDQLAANHARGPNYQDEAELPPHTDPPVRLIAYYLPQFHPIPENDEWWGKGFTEWTNVSKALPRFKGHYQPHLPGELGFYDLRLPSTLQRQAELVRNYGLEGLCFHHYWFAGRLLLDTPLRLLLKHPEINLPFCINWANENWSRRWDGSDDEILIRQIHSPADDLAFAVSLEPFFRDRRYIRVGGRPLLMVYRPKSLPDAAATVRRWREHFKIVGLGDPYIVMAQTFGDQDPRPYGMDAAAGIPPHNSGFGTPPIQNSLDYLDPNYQGTVLNYADMVAAALANRPTDFLLFPGVCPSWDNEARRPGRGTCFLGSNPTAYHDWLAAACKSALAAPQRDERIVFINAWNEWAEGAHLEPDRHLGYAYLAETARVAGGLNCVGPDAVQRFAVSTRASGTTLMPSSEREQSRRTRSGDMLRGPHIGPVPEGAERTLWSVMIPTYNRSTYLARTLESVLVQDPGRDKMQIEVVDNCSTVDDPEPVVRAVAGDRVIFTRNSRNLGLMPNFNRCIERARGHLVHILHSDDWVEPTFYSLVGDLAARYPDCAFLATRAFIVDETEVIIGVTPRVKWMENPAWDVTPMLSTQYFRCPSVVVRRALYEQCGGFIPELVYTGDWEMWVRAVHSGGGIVHPDPLANYRESAGYETGRLARSGENVRDYLRLSIHLSRYPGFSPTVLPNVAASEALQQYYRFANEGDVAAAQANLKAYKEIVPFPAWAITGVLNRLRHRLQNVSRIIENRVSRRRYNLRQTER